MARYTRDEMLQKLRDLTDKPVVYKTEVDDAKYHLSNVFDAEKYKIGEAFTHAGQWQNLTEAERKIDLPYELRHLFGKKFIKSIDDAKAELGRSTDYIDAVGSMVSELSLLHTLMQNLIARQVKGRRPAESTKKVIGTRVQHRAICPCCFRQQAVNGGRMVAHGYTLEHGYQNGNCMGRDKLHFGTESGRDLAASTARVLEEQADKNAAVADKLRAGDTSIVIFDRKSLKVIENPTRHQMNAAAAEYESSAYGQRYHANFLKKMVAEWTPQDPIEVVVEITE